MADKLASVQFLDESPEKSTGFGIQAHIGEMDLDAPSQDVTMAAGFLPKVQFAFQQLQEARERRFKDIRSWAEFFDTAKFSKPGKAEAFTRIRRNGSYFYSNYIIVAILSSLYILLINPVFLICMLLALALYQFLKFRSEANAPLRFGDIEISYTEAYIGLGILTLIVFYFTNGSSTIFWLALSSVGSVLLHAIFREPRIEEPDAFSYV